jgi:translocation and assembly module TamA
MRLKQVLLVQRFNPQCSLSLNKPSRFCRILIFFLVLLLFWSVTAAATVKIEITVTGVKDPLYKNIMARLTINLQKDNEKLQPKAIRMLHRQAEEDIQSALAPFGYYNPVITSSLKKKGETFIATYVVKKGPPVIVKDVNLELTGAGRKNKRLLRTIKKFPVKVGAVLDQSSYEQGKKNLVYGAISEGFLDAAFTERALRIDKERNSGSVFLVLETGPQYLFGETTSRQHFLDDDLLYRYLPYKEGDPYNPAKLFELQSILYRTDYFRQVVVQGQTDDSLDYRVPVEIDLTPPKHLNKYSLGLGYATDTGVRAKLDWTNRLFNSRGHKISASFMVGEYEKAVAIRYDIPRADPRYNKLVNTLSYQDKEWDDTITKLFAASVLHEYSGPRFNISGGVELRDEVYDVGNTNGDSTLLVPSLRAGVVFADDVLNTKNGLKTGVSFLGAVEGFISDATFLQSTVNGKAIVTPIKNWRVLGRGSLGVTLVDSIDDLPPSLRFYTGGDNSIRGYSYRSIGTKDSSGAVIGGRYLVVGSVELERIVAANFSLATFWDVGTATDDLALDFSQGVGGGVRYRLPFGQIKLDVASAITEDGNPIRIHLTVGGDL